MPEKREKIFIIDVAKCDGCGECIKACSLTHFGKNSPPHSRIRIDEFPDGNLHVPVFCQACEEALCIKVCPMNARIKLSNGAVVTDENRCIGCRTCVYVCPTGAPVENPESGKLMTCDRCLDEQSEPVCVQACAQQQALKFVDACELAAKTARQYAQRIKSAYRPSGCDSGRQAPGSREPSPIEDAVQ